MIRNILDGYNSDVEGRYYITRNPFIRDGLALVYWIMFTSIAFYKIFGIGNPITIFQIFYGLGGIQGFGVFILYFAFTSVIFGWLPSMFTLRILKVLKDLFS